MANVRVVIPQLFRKGLTFLLLVLLHRSIVFLLIALCPLNFSCDFVGKLSDLLLETPRCLLLGRLDFQRVVFSNFTQCYQLPLSAFVLRLQQPVVNFLHATLDLLPVFHGGRSSAGSFHCRPITIVGNSWRSTWGLFSIGLPRIIVALEFALFFT